MNKTLVILAAGIGSRYGVGIKQLEAVDDHGHLIIDYSIHDAIAAGFDRIVFIIRHDIEEDFRERIGERIETVCEPVANVRAVDSSPVVEGERTGAAESASKRTLSSQTPFSDPVYSEPLSVMRRKQTVCVPEGMLTSPRVHGVGSSGGDTDHTCVESIVTVRASPTSLEG